MLPKSFKRLQFVLLLTIASYLSLVPKPGAVFESSPDKFLHLLCWGVLVISLHLALERPRAAWKPAAGLFIYSILVEIGQIWVPNRFFSVADIVANGAGIACGMLIVTLLGRGFERLQWKSPFHSADSN